ncbi:permease [Granulicella aggregans]|uniref:permease n=1 Tax=Granulicella aggregans TaxID=474949 RepID=UPI0021E0A72F|nr:permease [Granulicella aggregans]
MSTAPFSVPTVAVAAPTRRLPRLEVSLSILLAVSIALIFWTQQRYPALLKKLHAGNGVKVAGTISFDALLKVTPEMPVPEQIAKTSVNWLYTNRFGMYFAVPFGAAMMTLFAGAMVPKRFESAAGNVLCGAVAGAPLGVCTNCATPVAQSLIVGGASTRMTLAAMIASPTMNPVVVAMAFVLFPLHIALWRVAVPVLLLACVPLLVAENKRKILSMGSFEEQPSLGARLAAFGAKYLRNFARLFLMTLPWMLLAAVLGATMAVVIPAYGTHLPVSVIGVIGVAIVGTLLPVPMALDVALAFVLYRAGAPAAYVVALLCTLGPVSVYSLSAMSELVGKKAGLRLAGAVAGLGVMAGLAVMWSGV